MPFVRHEGARIHWRVDGRADAPPLIMVPSLGTDHSMWDPVIDGLAEHFRVIRIDKRGHGASDVPPGEYSIDLLARDVLAVADAAQAPRFSYAGLSIGGMIGMRLAATAGERIDRMVLSNTTAEAMRQAMDERITKVLLHGMDSVADAVIGRFFSERTARRRTVHYETIRQGLLNMDPVGYAGCAAAIRDMDLVPLLARIRTPVLVIAGTHDQSTPAEKGRQIAQAIEGARYVELPTTHLGASEQPGRFVDLAVRFLRGEAVDEGPRARLMAESERFEAGLARRKEVLGSGYVEQRIAQATPFVQEFQDLITRYAWGEIWNRPMFDDRLRRLLVLAMTIGMGRWEEFRLHVDKGLDAELQTAELEELLLAAAVYCGVPAANTAFHHACDVLNRRQD